MTIFSKYNPERYWKERGKTYYDNFKYNEVFVNQEKHLIEFMQKHIIPTSVLEVGCGFGRISNLLMVNFPNTITKYDAIDLSSDQIKKARSISDPRINFINTDIETFFNTSTQYYDLVLAIEVLMHIKPKELTNIINMLLSMGKHLLHIDYCLDVTDIKLKNYNFNHNYFKIYKDLNKPIITERIGRQVIFLV